MLSYNTKEDIIYIIRHNLYVYVRNIWRATDASATCMAWIKRQVFSGTVNIPGINFQLPTKDLGISTILKHFLKYILCIRERERHTQHTHTHTQRYINATHTHTQNYLRKQFLLHICIYATSKFILTQIKILAHKHCKAHKLKHTNTHFMKNTHIHPQDDIF